MHLGKNKTTKIIKTWISGDRRTTVSGAKCMRKPFLRGSLGQNACRNLFWGLRAVPPLQRRKNDAAIVNLNRACLWPPLQRNRIPALGCVRKAFFFKGSGQTSLFTSVFFRKPLRLVVMRLSSVPTQTCLADWTPTLGSVQVAGISSVRVKCDDPST